MLSTAFLASGGLDEPFSALKIVFYLAIILLSTKLLGLVARKLGLPQVVGMVVAGLLIGSSIIGEFGWSFRGLIDPTQEETDVLSVFSQIGVILILFSSGLETDVKELKKSGFAATTIALMGVLVPIVCGTVVAMLFMGNDYANTDKLLNAIFVGVILAATSVGITVETLRELGKLNSKLGTTVLSAAIIDDVIGIIVLSIVTSLNGGAWWVTLLKSVGFFAATIGVGLLLRIVFKWMGKRNPHTRRTGIFAIAVCFVYAFAAEHFFGIAAITGAYMAGLMLSGLHETAFIDRKVLVSGYMIFTPIFFAFIGINADFSNFVPTDLLFGLAFVAAGVFGKVLGCGTAAKACKFDTHDSATIGFGMIARGEVALAVYATGSSLIYTAADGTVLGIDPLVATIMLIVITSILCPIFLKLMFRNKKTPEVLHAEGEGPQFKLSIVKEGDGGTDLPEQTDKMIMETQDPV